MLLCRVLDTSVSVFVARMRSEFRFFFSDLRISVPLWSVRLVFFYGVRCIRDTSEHTPT